MTAERVVRRGLPGVDRGRPSEALAPGDAVVVSRGANIIYGGSEYYAQASFEAAVIWVSDRSGRRSRFRKIDSSETPLWFDGIEAKMRQEDFFDANASSVHKKKR